MSRRGNPYDNAKAESFMKTLKVEAVYLVDYEPLRMSLPIFPASSTRSTIRSAAFRVRHLSPAQFEDQHAARQTVKAPA